MSKIIGIISLFKPQLKNIECIESYVDKLDYCLILDDSGFSNKELFKNFFAKHKNAEYILNKKNMGLCKSVNKGVKKAIELHADWVLIVDQDGTFSPNALSIFRKFIKNHNCEKIAIITPQLDYDRHPRKPKIGYKEINYSDLSGSLYNASILKEQNLFDENTYFYGLDAEYCIRAKQKGYKIIQCKEAILNHHPGETKILKLFGKEIYKYGWDRSERFYYQFRSTYYIHKKYGILALRNDLLHLNKCIKVILFFENKKEYFKMIKEGIIDARKNYYGRYKSELVRESD